MLGAILCGIARRILAAEPTQAAASPAATGVTATPATLSALDYAQIEQLVHRLQYALDFCTNGGRDFADLFAQGGQFIIDQGAGDVRVVSTREQLVKLAGGPDCQALRTPPRSYILHTEANLVIDPEAGGARGISYAIYPANHGHYYKDEFAGQVGLYFDKYLRTRDGWRLKSRRHMVNINPAVAPALVK
jgi:hypothetical protein